MMIDSHCHLDMVEQKDNLDEVIKRARDAGVTHMQTICTSLDELPRLIEITEKYDNIFASVGIHPNEVKEITSADQLIELQNHEKIIGLGETGLDYYYKTASRENQIKSFEQHIIASQKTALPLIVHTRDAEEDTNSIMKDHLKTADFAGLIHCFTGSKDLARKILDLGFYISISGIATFKNATELQDIVRFLPLDRLLIETDSPFLSPVPVRGKQNEPSFVKHVAEFIAQLKGVGKEELCRITSDNFFTLFSKARR